MKKVSIVDLPEDLLETHRSKGLDKTRTFKPKASTDPINQARKQIAAGSLIAEVSQILEMDSHELSD